MFDNNILGNGGTLKFVPDCYKHQKTCTEAVDNYARELELVSDYCQTLKNV